MTWFQIFTLCWQIACVITPLMVASGMVWLRAQFVTKTDFTAEKNRVDGKLDAAGVSLHGDISRLNDHRNDHETRIKLLESEVGKPPTRHTLNNNITTLVAAVAGLERTVSGLAKQADTTQSYLHTLVERGLDR